MAKDISKKDGSDISKEHGSHSIEEAKKIAAESPEKSETIKLNKAELRKQIAGLRANKPSQEDVETRKLSKEAAAAKALAVEKKVEEQARQALEEAYGEAIQVMSPEREQETIEEREALEPAREFSEYTSEQLQIALDHTLELRAAIMVESEKPNEDISPELQKAIQEMPIIVTANAASFERRKDLEALLGGLPPDLDESYIISDIRTERNVEAVKEVLSGSNRAELMIREYPLLTIDEMDVHPNVRESNKLGHLQSVSIRELVSEMERLIYVGGAKASDFETDKFGDKSHEVANRLQDAETAHAELSPQEWQEAGQARRFMKEEVRWLLRDIPLYASQLKGSDNQREQSIALRKSVEKNVQDWYSTIPDNKQRKSAQAYVDNYVDLIIKS